MLNVSRRLCQPPALPDWDFCSRVVPGAVSWKPISYI